jgi:hypothetical protein
MFEMWLFYGEYNARVITREGKVNRKRQSLVKKAIGRAHLR